MQTKVVNKRYAFYDVYIGRGSPFGNPYTHLLVGDTKAEFQVATREESIVKYREWLLEQVKNPDFLAKVLALRGKVLGCYCKHPFKFVACHGDVIVEWLEQRRIKVKTYVGHIVHLEQNQVFVFGSNLDGFHGAGAAGYASFGVSGNSWRDFDYANKPNGWKGKWNVKGIAEGFQTGTEGSSYALPTVVRAGGKRSRSPEEIKESIRKFYDFARRNPPIRFLVAQKNEKGLNGYSPEEMAEMFSSYPIPENVWFEEGFSVLLSVLECN